MRKEDVKASVREHAMIGIINAFAKDSRKLIRSDRVDPTKAIIRLAEKMLITLKESQQEYVDALRDGRR